MRSVCNGCTRSPHAFAATGTVALAFIAACAGGATIARAQGTASAGALTIALQTYEAARQAEIGGQPSSVEFYFQAATQSWQALQPEDFSRAETGPYSPTWNLYHNSLAGLIRVSQLHRRFTPQQGIRLNSQSGYPLAPAMYSGFSWSPQDFQHLLVVGNYQSKSIRQIHRRAGLGVPLVVVRYQPDDSGYFYRRHEFGATVVLHPTVTPPAAEPEPGAANAPSMTLEFFDSVAVRNIPVRGLTVPLAADLTAPLAYEANATERTYWEDFFNTNTNHAKPKLGFIEPYRPGRIPVVLIHGLLSDSQTWLDVANDLRAVPEIMDRYQIWAFHYPTGIPFLASAAALREELYRAVATLDPSAADPALRHMVLVGHSMGGLIAKLQVTYSGSTIWNSYVNRPWEQIVASPDVKAKLQRAFFFDPVPYVRRVAFIGVPHGGSSLASRAVGRIGAACVKLPVEEDKERRLLLQYNPGVFDPSFNRRFPNSIDLLEPNSPLLAAMRRLPVAPGVQLHSIIGTGYPVAGYGDGDGVVPVSSALHAGVQTQRMVHAKHESLHHQAESFEELLAILAIHAAALQP